MQRVLICISYIYWFLLLQETKAKTIKAKHSVTKTKNVVYFKGQVASRVDQHELEQFQEKFQNLIDISKHKAAPESRRIDTRKTTSSTATNELDIRCPHWGEEMTNKKICEHSVTYRHYLLAHMGQHIRTRTFQCEVDGCRNTRGFTTACKYK